MTALLALVLGLGALVIAAREKDTWARPILALVLWIISVVLILAVGLGAGGALIWWWWRS